MSFKLVPNKFMIFLAFLFLVSGCAGHLPVPGGTDTVNQSFYTTKEDLLDRLNTLRPGMTEAEAFSALGHDKLELVQLERDQIITSLYGSSAIEFRDGLPDHEDSRTFLQSLYGYRLNYKTVEHEHGFSSPIRIRTDESGFYYTVTLVFREGILYAPPILAGGVVNRSTSKTFFDYFNPGSIVNYSVG